jgi:hypothetical protein
LVKLIAVIAASASAASRAGCPGRAWLADDANSRRPISTCDALSHVEIAGGEWEMPAYAIDRILKLDR